MSTDTWLAFALFAFVSSITPGPNNTMLLASGVNFGFVRSLPHMAGVTVGFCLMILLMGLGLGSVFVRFPVLYTVLRYVGGTYMLYLAWKIFRSQPASSTDNNTTAAQPIGFTAAAALRGGRLRPIQPAFPPLLERLFFTGFPVVAFSK